MKNPLKQIIEYYKKRPVWSLVSDIFFVVLLVLLLIPPTRREIASRFIRLTMRQPVEKKLQADGSIRLSDHFWPLSGLREKDILLSDLEGKVVFLNFWATWCPPCIAEMPSIQNLFDEFGHRVSFVLVTREQPETVSQFMQDKGYNLPVYIQRYREPEVFAYSTIPATFIISSDGRIVVDKKGAAKWDGENTRRLLEGLLGE